ncbi:TauD/TfdA family dioxygenase [Streptomyces rimosus]|uniref:TauD/TfdA family dioxygenase n=1 Tax=Streptomyces rimosus TaxID=1927 RepID=UPI000B1FECCF|nr:TauD/TfdA family dioxygenase [Streptomyces rimosus]
MDETAARAFDELREAMLAVLAGTALEAGDLIIVDNRAAVHGRTAFRPRYDGQDRWQRRCSRSPTCARPAPSGPPDPRCAPLGPVGAP